MQRSEVVVMFGFYRVYVIISFPKSSCLERVKLVQSLCFWKKYALFLFELVSQQSVFWSSLIHVVTPKASFL